MAAEKKKPATMVVGSDVEETDEEVEDVAAEKKKRVERWSSMLWRKRSGSRSEKRMREWTRR